MTTAQGRRQDLTGWLCQKFWKQFFKITPGYYQSKLSETHLNISCSCSESFRDFDFIKNKTCSSLQSMNTPYSLIWVPTIISYCFPVTDTLRIPKFWKFLWFSLVPCLCTHCSLCWECYLFFTDWQRHPQLYISVCDCFPWILFWLP